MSEVRRYQERGIDGYALSIDVIPGDPPPLTYEGKYPYGQDALEASVHAVQQSGDNFDNRNSLSWRYLAGQQIVPLSVAAEMAASQGTVPPAAVALTTVSMAVATFLNRRKDKSQLQEQYGQRYQDAAMVGQSYELYRPVGHADAVDKEENTHQNSDVELVWYGPLADSERLWDRRDNLVQMATMAKKAGIKTMHVDLGAKKDVHFSYAAVNARTFLWQKKHIQAHTWGKHFITKSPEEWMELPAEIPETREAYDPATKKQLIADRLRVVNPSLPLAEVLEDQAFLSTAELLNERSPNPIKEAATDALNRRLRREEYYPGAIREQIVDQKQREVNRQDMVASEDAYISVVPNADAGVFEDVVTWRTKYGPQTQETLAALGLTQAEYAQYINMSVDQIREGIQNRTFEDPKKIAVALELAAFRLSYGGKAPLVSEVAQIEQKYRGSGYGPELTMQDALKFAGDNKSTHKGYSETINLRRHRILQYGVGIVATAALSMGLAALHHEADSRNEVAVEHAKHTLAAKNHVGPEVISEGDAQDLVNSRSIKARAYNSWNELVNQVSGSWPDVPALFKGGSEGEDGKVSSVSQGSFEVGNVNHSGKDTDQFKINAFNGASAEGFWFTGTAKDLVVKSEDDKLASVEWQIQKTIEEETNVPIVLPFEYVNSPRLRIFRDLVDTQQTAWGSKSGDDQGPLGEGRFIVPVREGTKLVAASIDNKPVKLMRITGNTYALQLSEGQEVTGKLSYWLVEDKDAAKPEATGPITINATEGDDSVLGPRAARLKKQLRDFYPPQLPNDNGARAEQISRDWSYALDPFTDEQKSSWKTLDDMLTDAEKNKLANCNVSNTDAILSNPTTNMEFGFLNGAGATSGALSTFELHQKTILRDATPSVTAASPAESNRTERDLNIPYRTIGLVGLGLAAAYTQRRRVVRVGRKIIDMPYAAAARKDAELNAQIEYAFAAHSDAAYLTAAAAAEHIAYAGRPLTQAALRQSEARLESSVSGARSQALLSRPHMVSHGMSEYVSAVANEVKMSDAALAEQLRQSAVVIANGADVLALRSGAAYTENVDRFNNRVARFKRLGRKVLFLK